MAIRNYRYYIRVVNGNTPVLGSVVKRKSAPKTGKWVDISNCIGECCSGAEVILNTPQNFVATDGAAGVINLAWSAVTGATSYRLERATNSAFTTGLTQVYLGSNLTFSNTGLTSGTAYYYRLSAIGTNTSDFNTLTKTAP